MTSQFSNMSSSLKCFDVVFFPLSSLVTGPNFMSIIYVKVIWLNVISASSPITMGWPNLTKIFLTFVAGWTSSGWIKMYGGVIFIAILLHFHYLISLETANTQESEVVLLRISKGNVNASLVTCWYPQIYDISSRKEFLETHCKYITTNYKTLLVKNNPASCVFSL